MWDQSGQKEYPIYAKTAKIEAKNPDPFGPNLSI